MMCVYCNGVTNKSLLDGGYSIDVAVYAYEDEGYLVIYNHGTGETRDKRINYCPVCGRNLNGVKA